MRDAATPLTLEMAETARSNLDDHLSLLDALVGVPSHASSPGGTDQVAGLLLPRLEHLGFSVERIPTSPLPEDMAWVERIMMPGQVLTELGPTYRLTSADRGGPRLLLLGDLDTSYTPEAHEAFPVRRDDTKFYGPGVADMKAGLVVLLSALEILASSGAPHPDLEIVLSADEQAGSLASRHVIEESARRCSWTLCVECSRRGGQLMAGRGHIGIGDITASGVEAHAGSDYASGVNATEYLARVIPPLNALSRPDEGILVTVTLLDAGRRRSVIPDRAWGVLDIRTPSEAAWERTTSAINDTVARYGEGHVRARSYAHRPGVTWTRETDDLLTVIRDRAAAVDVEIAAFASAAAGSSAFAGGHTVVMDGMGPVGGGLMTPDEYVVIDSIPERSAILASTIAALGEEGPAESAGPS